MNERILELEGQCWETVQATESAHSWQTKFNTKKFAELIVRECMDAIYNIDDLGGYHFKAATAVKEHFGVEE